MAEDVVNRVICDPIMTQEHEKLARMSTYIFSAVAVIIFVRWKWTGLTRWKSVFVMEAIGVLIAGYLLVRASHLGVSLVYQQGAGVYRTTQECEEFE